VLAGLDRRKADSPMDQLLQSGPWPDTVTAAPMAVAEPVFTIGDLAHEFGVTLRALRFYEIRGLLSPRRNGHARVYRQADRERLALILRGKKLGFSLDEIGGMLAAGPGSEPQASLVVSREKCIEQINLLERRKRQIETALAELRLAYAGSEEPLPRRREVRAEL
jgi:DNA-binding transcriptional MerR regulator